jgi:hypothetical protein
MDQLGGTAPITKLARLKIDNELIGLARERLALKEGMTLYAFKVARIASRILVLLRQRGADLSTQSRVLAAFASDAAPQVPAKPRAATGQFYEFNPNRKHSERKKDNAAAIALLRDIAAGTITADSLDEAQKQALAKYSGTGGNLIGTDGLAGSAYEYYTPKPIADGMWSLLGELGFKGGKVGDPCAGVGIFGATAPANVAMESVELNETSGRINQLVNGGPSYNAIVSPFEAVASRTPDEIWDAVISNVPFGGVHDRGSNRKIDPKYQDQPLETYFILRSLEKLRPGGLAAFIVPPRVVSAKSGREEQLRIAASYMAEFMGAYRLPNSVFGTADADTITDVIVFKKFGRAAAQKIEELRTQNPSALIAANVLWDEFTTGRYFAGEGKRYVLGEFVAKDPSKFRDVDRVVSDASVANIGKLLRKFPGSRIDWKALEAEETEPISYNEGDSLTLAGQTLELRGGAWVPVGKAASDSTFDAYGPLLSTPLQAVSAKVGWDQAIGYLEYLHGRSMDLDVPVWLRLAATDVAREPAAERTRLWSALTAGCAVVDVMQAHAAEPQFNYLEEFAVLSDTLVATAQTVLKAPTKFSRQSKAAFMKARIVYSRRDGFAPIWKGEGAAGVDIGRLDEEAQVRALQYAAGAAIDVKALKGVYGEDFDVMAEDGWCLDAAGERATKADDYYTGKYADFLRRIDAEISASTGPLREKLLRQRAMAEERVERVDPQALRYNLFSPFVTIEEKAEFMRRFMHPGFAVGVNNLGNPYIVYEGPSGKNATTEENLMSRMAAYVSGNAGGVGARSLSLAGKEVGLPDRDALKLLSNYAKRLDTQFDGWVKANPVITSRMDATANDPERLYFTEVDDNTPLGIPGMNPELTLHGYQNAYVRKQARSFGGLNGYDVGLGKTFTALACVQYVQSIGVKKKTIFVVPNAVLSNWRREATRAYLNTDDCLFIGLDINQKTLKATVNPANYARDFTRVLENRHRKIFCTLEAFSSLPLKDETIGRYEDHLVRVDSAFLPDPETAKKADRERANSKLAEATGGTGTKSTAFPFFEDLGIDTLVSDEGHMFKNSKDTLEFSGAKFLSVAEASQRGRDMQMKAWYVRSLSAANDGVLPLTATPITNSPLEIYSMLTLAVGEEKVHDLMLGIKGADAFMDAMCMIEDGEDVGIDGTVKSYRIFTGLQNVTLLRGAIAAVATIKTGKDVKAGGDDLKLPDAPEMQIPVDLPGDTRQRLNEYKMAYRAAKEATGMASKDAEPVTPEEVAAFEKVQARLGEDAELIAHPFNLIQKMTALIADPELDERATFYTILASQRPEAEAVIAAFNKLGKIEKRARGGPWTDSDAVVGQVTVKDGGDESIMYRIKVRAKMTPDGRVVIDTTTYGTQLEFEKLADKAKLDLDCTIPPKLAALLRNVQAEEAAPRSKTGRVKQLIFCDILPLHNKIKRILSKHAGIPASAIEIVSGQSIKNPEQMQGIQDGFNAEGDDNKYRLVIANEKAEVGINLQKGTQAIHHLTIGWTPDSQHQRNGRGVRQGNTTGYVNIYHYDADGTFDEYKRTLTVKKADWIGAVMDKQGGNEVKVSGGLTAEQYDELIESMGNAGAIQAIQDRAALREALQRADSARARQVINLQTADAQLGFLKQFPQARHWLQEKAMVAYDLHAKLGEMRARKTDKMKPATLIRFEDKIEELDAKLQGIVQGLDAAGRFRIPYRNEVLSISEALERRLGQSDLPHKRREAFSELAATADVLSESSDLVMEWESEVAQAEAMTEQAFKDFVRVGVAGDGAYSPRLVDAFKAGQGVILDGRPFCDGMLIRTSEGELMMVVERATHAQRFPNVHMKLADAVRGSTVIGFESSAYDAAVAECAAYDDSIEAVEKGQVDKLFSSISADVAKRRTKSTVVRYFAGGRILLPSPHFPYPIDPENTYGSELLDGIVARQAQVIKRWEKDYMFIPTTVAVTEDGYDGGAGARKVRAFAAYVRGHGLRATTLDLSVVLHGSARQSGNVLHAAGPTMRFPADATQRLEAATTVEELDAAAMALVHEACDWMVIPEEWTLLHVASPFGRWDLASTYNGMARRIREAKEAAERAAELAANPVPQPSEQFQAYRAWIDAGKEVPPGMVEQIKADLRLQDGEADQLLALLPEPEPEAPAAPAAVDLGGVEVSGEGKIGLTGETMARVQIGGKAGAVKDFIKMAAQEIGEKAKWRGDQLQWDVTPAALGVLREKFPAAAKLVTVVPAVA